MAGGRYLTAFPYGHHHQFIHLGLIKFLFLLFSFFSLSFSFFSVFFLQHAKSFGIRDGLQQPLFKFFFARVFRK